jgi:hypothetical protein
LIGHEINLDTNIIIFPNSFETNDVMGNVLNYIKSFEKFIPYKRIGNYNLKELYSELPLNSFSNSEIIHSVINSHFYFWGGEDHPSGQTFNSSTKHLEGTITNNTIINKKFHGFYDVNKLDESDYKLIERNIFNRIIEKAINSFSDDEPSYLQEAKKYINEYITDKCLIFHLAIDRELENDKIDKHNVYGIFEGFLIIDRNRNTIAILEIGDE